MRFLYLFVFFFFCLYSHHGYNSCSLFDCDIPSVPPPPCPNYFDCYWQILTLRHPYEGLRCNSKNFNIEINCYGALQILILNVGVLFLLWPLLLNLTNHVNYVKFNTGLNLGQSFFSLLGLLLCECEKDQILLLANVGMS